MASPELILVVEDDSDIRDNLRAFLQYEGYRVHSVKHGQEALDYLDGGGERPSLILLDLMMPVLDGWRFREKQLASPHGDIPVLVFTAMGNFAPIRADAVLKKPIDLDLLAETVRALCEGKPAPP